MPAATHRGALRWLAAKEWRELLASRATLLVALAVGPLVGHAFIAAVETYAEASGAGGGPAALPQGLSPLDGIVVPTFGAYAIAATLLFPFVAIRLLAAEKESGALDLLVQMRPSLTRMVIAKLVTLVVAWIALLVPGLAALALWRGYGGHLAAPEVATVLAGYVLRGALVAALGLAAAALTDGAASAAVLTLALTLGAWAVDFIAQVRGGWAMTASQFTPEAVIRTFERGELRADVVLVTLVIIVACIALVVIWTTPGRRATTRVVRTVATLAIGAVAVLGATRISSSLDLSEDRRSSFSVADERALRTIDGPLRIAVHLAPEDPRLADLERSVLRKLRRSVRDVRIEYAARSGTGLFEGSGEHYGEVWYRLGGREAMTRSTTGPIVLETIYGLAGLAAPTPDPGDGYPGHPLAARPTGAALLFFVLWPIGVALLWFMARRPRAPRSAALPSRSARSDHATLP